MTRTKGAARRTADPAALPAASPAAAVDDPVPRLPRGRGLRLSRPELLRVVGLAGVLVFLIATQRPCASAVSKFVTSFGDQGSAAAVMPRPGTIDLPASAGSAGSAAPAGTRGSGAAADPAGSELDGYERLRPGMTEAEIKAVIDRARTRAADRPGSAHD